MYLGTFLLYFAFVALLLTYTSRITVTYYFLSENLKETAHVEELGIYMGG